MVTQFFLTDALGSVLASFSDTPNSAAVLGNQVYGPYGNQRYLKGTMGTAKGYTGQYADPTGLDYYNARYYDPVAGVFLSADSKQGNAQGMNPYAYVAGNPETFTDPTGYMPAPPPGVGGTSGNSLDQWWIEQAQAIYKIMKAKVSIWGTNITSEQVARNGIRSTVEDAYDHHRFNNQVQFNWYIAYTLAMGIEGYRQYQPDHSNANYADAFWYLTDNTGTMVDDGFLAAHAQASRGVHSEVILMMLMMGQVRGFQGMLMNILSNLPGGSQALESMGLTLHIVMFTQTAMCTRCQGFVAQQANALAQQLSSWKIGLDFTTWTTNDPANVPEPNTPKYLRDPGVVYTPFDVRPDLVAVESGFLS
jgi:RHS repeat-associated protein